MFWLLVILLYVKKSFFHAIFVFSTDFEKIWSFKTKLIMKLGWKQMLSFCFKVPCIYVPYIVMGCVFASVSHQAEWLQPGAFFSSYYFDTLFPHRNYSQYQFSLHIFVVAVDGTVGTWNMVYAALGLYIDPHALHCTDAWCIRRPSWNCWVHTKMTAIGQHQTYQCLGCAYDGKAVILNRMSKHRIFRE